MLPLLPTCIAIKSLVPTPVVERNIRLSDAPVPPIINGLFKLVVNTGESEKTEKPVPVSSDSRAAS